MSAVAAQAWNPALLRLLALLTYPVLIAITLWLGQPEWRALGLPLLAIAVVGPWPSQWGGRLVLLLSLPLAAAVILVPSLALWPPGLVCLATAAWFGKSLLAGQKPLIGQFASIIQARHGGALPDDAEAWLRGWTWLWTALLGLLGAIALLLAVTEQTALWLLWVSLVIPGMVLLTLVGEYLLRRRRFSAHEHPSLGEFLMLLAHVRPEHLGR